MQSCLSDNTSVKIIRITKLNFFFQLFLAVSCKLAYLQELGITKRNVDADPYNQAQGKCNDNNELAFHADLLMLITNPKIP